MLLLMGVPQLLHVAFVGEHRQIQQLQDLIQRMVLA